MTWLVVTGTWILWLSHHIGNGKSSQHIPTDELHHFFGGWLNHQPVWDIFRGQLRVFTGDTAGDTGCRSKVNFIAVTSPAYEGAFRFEAAYRKGEV